MQKKLVITGGGTAGHVIPCIAVAEQLPDWEIHYIGRKEGIERELAEKHGIAYHGIDCPRFVRDKPWTIFGIPKKLHTAKKQARILLEEIAPDAVFSKGGYVSLPVVLAARGIPVVLHESDLSFGLANRLVLRRCAAVCSSFPMKRRGVICTGSPLLASIYKGDKDAAMRLCGFNGKKRVLLVTGGSLGARALNAAVDGSFGELIKRYDIIHLTGRGSERTRSEGYFPLEFTDRIHSFMKAADYAVTRGGGNTIFELAALGVPSLIVPLPKGVSRGDQVENADFFDSHGWALYAPQEDVLRDGLVCHLRKLEEKAGKIVQSLRIGKFDGSKEIAKIIREAASN